MGHLWDRVCFWSRFPLNFEIGLFMLFIQIGMLLSCNSVLLFTLQCFSFFF